MSQPYPFLLPHNLSRPVRLSAIAAVACQLSPNFAACTHQISLPPLIQAPITPGGWSLEPPCCSHLTCLLCLLQT